MELNHRNVVRFFIGFGNPGISDAVIIFVTMNASHILFGIFVVCAVFFAFPLATSILGGWYCLSKEYGKSKNLTAGQRYGFVSGSLKRDGWIVPATYGGCLGVNVTEDGLGLSIQPMLRFLHPPLFIPWQCVASCIQQTTGFSEYVVLRVYRVQTSIRFDGAVGERVYSAYRNRLREA